MPSTPSQPGGSARPGLALWHIAIIVGFILVFALTTLISGEVAFLIPGVLLALIVLGYTLLQRRLSQRTLQRHGGDLEAALADNEDPIPAVPNIGDDDRPAGDTPEVHDEVSPHDLPMDHPGRQAAEAMARGKNGTTRGHKDGGAGGGHLGDAERDGATVGG